MALPKDPIILLSYVNTKLRDFYPSLEEFCKAEGTVPETVAQALAAAGYRYDERTNQFI